MTVLKPTTPLICVVIYTVSTYCTENMRRKKEYEMEPDMVTEKTARQLTIPRELKHFYLSNVILILLIVHTNTDINVRYCNSINFINLYYFLIVLLKNRISYRYQHTPLNTYWTIGISFISVQL